jgi:putative membrane protein
MRQLAIVLLSFSLAAFGQNASQSSTTGKSKSSKAGGASDAQFATKAAQGNMAEVELGKLATEKSQNDDVKKFGQRMMDDHTKAEQDLEGVASKDNLTVPKGPNAEQKAEKQRLEKLSGAAFDRAYMHLMVKDHTNDVAEFQKEANNTSANADLRDYAKRTYPTLEDHLTNAKAVNDTLTKSAASGKSTGKKSSTSSSTGAGTGLLLI